MTGLEVIVSSHDLEAKASGYCNNQPETRKQLIVEQLQQTGKVTFQFVKTSVPNLDLGLLVHDPGFIQFLSNAWSEWVPIWEILKGLPDFDFALEPKFRDTNEIPGFVPSYSAPRDLVQRPGPNILGQINYYVQDRMTPIRSCTVETLRWDLTVIQTAAKAIISDEKRNVYALVTYPGHHSGRKSLGGYCIINVAAVAASLLRAKYSKVAIIDVDYHSANGTMSIFWDDPDVMVVSLHADPAFEYPYNCGFTDQIGGLNAEGATLNIPIPPKSEWDTYQTELRSAIQRVKHFGAEVVVVSLGLDPIRGDPVQSPQAGISLDVPDYISMGRMFGEMELPLLIVQEGGYDLKQVPLAVDNFLSHGILSTQ